MRPKPSWVDPVIVERCVRRSQGVYTEPPDRRLTAAEALEVARTIRALGGGTQAVIRGLRCNPQRAKSLLEEAA